MVSCLSRLVNISVKVPKELRDQMKQVDVNWSEYLRSVIEAKVREELAKKASRRLGEIRERAGRIPTGEVIKWLREDRARSSG